MRGQWQREEAHQTNKKAAAQTGFLCRTAATTALKQATCGADCPLADHPIATYLAGRKHEGAGVSGAGDLHYPNLATENDKHRVAAVPLPEQERVRLQMKDLKKPLGRHAGRTVSGTGASGAHGSGGGVPVAGRRSTARFQEPH